MAKTLLRSGALTLLLAALVLGAAPARAASIKKEMAYAVDLGKKGLWHEAAHRFRLLLVRAPDHPRLWNDLAVAYEAVGRYDDAHQAYEKAVALMDSPPEEMLANQEAFEVFYRQWKGAEPPPATPATESESP